MRGDGDGNRGKGCHDPRLKLDKYDFSVYLGGFCFFK